MRIILIIIFSLASLTMFGQREKHEGRHGNQGNKMSHEQVESLKIAFLTKKLDLSPAEAQGFWPIYNEYSDKKHELRSTRKERHKILDMDEAQADELIDKYLGDKQRELDLDKTYVEKFKEVLPSQKVIMIFALDRKFKEEMLKDVRRRLNENN